MFPGARYGVTHRERNAVVIRDPRADVTRRIKRRLATTGAIDLENLNDYATVMGMKLEPGVATEILSTWNKVGVLYVV